MLKILNFNKCYDNEDGAGAGAPGVNGDAAGDEAAAADDSGEVSLAVSDNFWDDNKEGNAGEAAQTVAPVAEATPSSEDLFAKHVDGLQFGELALNADDMAAVFDSRDLSSLNTAVQGSLKQLYRQVMMDNAKMLKTHGEGILEKATAEIANFSTAKDHSLALAGALPFTQKPALKPMAEAVMSKAMANGQDVTAAIQTVKAFFKQAAESGSEELELQNNNPGSPGDEGFAGNAGNSGSNKQQPVNWAEFLTDTKQ